LIIFLHFFNNNNSSNNGAKIRSETWRAFEEIYASGKAKAIGVSNYTVEHLQEMVSDKSNYKVKVLPMVNQVELHPRLTQTELIKYCKSHGIIVEGYSPFGKGKLLKNADLMHVAKKYNHNGNSNNKVSVAQLIVRWHLQQGIVCIPKSDDAKRIEENMQVYDFNISDDDMSKISAMNDDWHCTWNPHGVK